MQDKAKKWFETQTEKFLEKVTDIEKTFFNAMHLCRKFHSKLFNMHKKELLEIKRAYKKLKRKKKKKIKQDASDVFNT